MNIELIDQPDQIEELNIRALSWPEKARSISITEDIDYHEAADCLKGIKALRSEAAEVFDPIISAAHHAHKEAITAKKGVEGPLIEAEGILKRGMARYQDEQERLRREEQRRLEADARKAAEEEALAAAIALEEAGEAEAAEQVIEAPLAPVIQLPPATPKVTGISSAVTYKARVTDLYALVCYISENPALIHLLKESQPDLNGMARRQKEAFSLPGVEVVKERSIRAGSR